MNKRDLVLKLVNEGRTTKEISLELGLSVSGVRYYRESSKHGIAVSSRIAEHRRRVKRKAIDYLGKKCSKCGYSKCDDALTFHHIDPLIKTLQISSGRTRSWDNIKEEIDKCLLLCHNCHSELHAGLWKIDDAMILELINSKLNYDDEPLEYYRSNQENKRIKKPVNNCTICNRETTNSKYCSNKCSNKALERIEWPDNLQELVNESSKLSVAKLLGVSDTAVSKRLKKLTGCSSAW